MMFLHTYRGQIQHPNSDLKIQVVSFIFYFSVWKWGYFGFLTLHASWDFCLLLLNCICPLYSFTSIPSTQDWSHPWICDEWILGVKAGDPENWYLCQTVKRVMILNDSCDAYTRLCYNTDFLWMVVIQHFHWQSCSAPWWHQHRQKANSAGHGKTMHHFTTHSSRAGFNQTLSTNPVLKKKRWIANVVNCFWNSEWVTGH